MTTAVEINSTTIDLAAQECHQWMCEGTEQWSDLDDDQRNYFRQMSECVLCRAASRERRLSDPPPLDQGPLAHLHRAQVEAEEAVSREERRDG